MAPLPLVSMAVKAALISPAPGTACAAASGSSNRPSRARKRDFIAGQAGSGPLRLPDHIRALVELRALDLGGVGLLTRGREGTDCFAPHQTAEDVGVGLQHRGHRRKRRGIAADQ